MLSSVKLRNLLARDAPYKVADRDGMYVSVSPKGTITFRVDYRLNGRRETLTLGKYDPHRAKLAPRPDTELEYGHTLSLAEARTLLIRARLSVGQGESPSQDKAAAKRTVKAGGSFRHFAELWLKEAPLADSTRHMRALVLNRDVLPALGNLQLEEITPTKIVALCDKIKARGAPATALHARDIINQTYNHAIGRGLKIENPAASVKPSAIATFKPRDRALPPTEIGIFFRALDKAPTLPPHRLGIRFALLTLLRKGEIINARWGWMDFEQATMTIPKEFMKARRPHVVYLSQQALDILIALQAWSGASPFILPSRYDTEIPIAPATLNRVISLALKDVDGAVAPFGMHDLRRTGATLLNEAGFNSDWIEKCLAHEQQGVRAVYNKAEYADQRRDMLQKWADMVDAWIAGAGADVVPIRKGKRA